MFFRKDYFRRFFFVISGSEIGQPMRRFFINNDSKVSLNDTQQFNRLYHDCRAGFIRFAETYVEDPAIAEDIVMDSLMYYWENRRLLKHEDNVPAYVLAAIKNKCINWLRRERLREEAERYLRQREDRELNLRLATLEACNPEKLFSDEIRQIVDRVLQSLPVRSREIFVRSKYENRTNREIADTMHLSVKSIEYHITKVLKILRIALKDYRTPIFFLFFV
jgi:RNA polymerase sigma-70 factor (ECF subfamily)